uniref:Uncharacterized protein n=1 Tax=Rhabditophanes sp. KR3021 TaxID=114890 RepID=A0AC35U7P2_9BILA
MRVFNTFCLLTFPLLISAETFVKFRGSQPSQQIRVQANRDRRPVEQFNDVVVRAHSLGESSQDSPSKYLSFTSSETPMAAKLKSAEAVVRRAPPQPPTNPAQINQTPMGSMMMPNLMMHSGILPPHPLHAHHHLMHPLHQHLGMVAGQPLIPGQPQPILHGQPQQTILPASPQHTLLQGSPLLSANPQPMIQFIQPPPNPAHPNLLSPHPNLFGQNLLSPHPMPSQSSNIPTLSPLSHHDLFTPIPGFPTFPPITMPPAFDKLVPEAIEARAKANRKLAPPNKKIPSYGSANTERKSFSKMNIEELESRLPKYTKQTSRPTYSTGLKKDNVWMVPYYQKN